jgi:hypothetical protein
MFFQAEQKQQPARRNGRAIPSSCHRRIQQETDDLMPETLPQALSACSFGILMATGLPQGIAHSSRSRIRGCSPAPAMCRTAGTTTWL